LCHIFPESYLKAKRFSQTTLINLVFIGGGIGFAGVLIFALLTVFPQLRPGMMVFTVRMEDTFYHHPEWVKRPENPDAILSIHRLAYDQDGFRLPAREAANYEILALGDSFTEAANVALPWSDILAQTSGFAVRNLGYRGYGPVEITRIIERYGQDETSRILIYGFFEGNDLNNVAASQQEPLLLPSEVEKTPTTLIDFDTVDQSNTRYPLTIQIGSTTHPITFFEWYVWNLNITRETLHQSQEIDFLRTEFERMQVAAGEKCLVIAYFPGKPHIYLPYLDEPSQQILLQNSHQRALDENMALDTIPQPELTFTELLSRLDYQRDAVQEVATSLGMNFFDTTPILASYAAAGEMLYYTNDTHWNQRGHTIVGEALAAYLASGVCAGA
jgi:hypothetical protein